MQIDPRTYRLTNATTICRLLLIVGVAGVLLSLAGFLFSPERSLGSYLVAFSFWISIALGALFFVMLHHLVGAVWSVVLRRLAESLMAALPAMVFLFIPLVLGLGHLYHWSQTGAAAGDALLQKKAPYLNGGFFYLRAAIYFAIWWVLVRSLHKTSLAQDHGFDQNQIKSFRRISAPGMILFAITVTFAAVDWLMSLNAHWYSTIFGVYVFSGSLVAVTCFLTLIVLCLRQKGILAEEITIDHYHDLGKLIFAFTILWAYMAFSQYLLVWYSNVPEETSWFHHRWEGGWKSVSLLIVFGHFVVPFIALISRAAKRNLTLLGIICVWLLAMHWIDLYWIVIPNLSAREAALSWMDASTMFGVGGLTLWFIWKKLTSNPVLPVNDPMLAASITHVNR